MSNGDDSDEEDHEQEATDFSPAEEAEEEDTDEEETTGFSPVKDEKEDEDG